jgi:hypothetical protein
MVEDPVGITPTPTPPGSVPVADLSLAPFDVKQFMTGNRSPAPTGTALVGPVIPSAPSQEPSLLARATEFLKNPPPWTAPPEAALLAAPEPVRRASPNPEPAPVSWPTTSAPPVNPPYTPTTTGQQIGGLSPFGTTGPQNNFPSMSLLPFEQWPPIGWGWAGPSFDFGGAWG